LGPEKRDKRRRGKRRGGNECQKWTQKNTESAKREGNWGAKKSIIMPLGSFSEKAKKVTQNHKGNPKKAEKGEEKKRDCTPLTKKKARIGRKGPFKGGGRKKMCLEIGRALVPISFSGRRDKTLKKESRDQI